MDLTVIMIVIMIVNLGFIYMDLTVIMIVIMIVNLGFIWI